MDLIKDNIPKLIRKIAVPASVGTLFQTLYNVVDSFFAGKISPEALSALSKSFPIYFIIVGTCIGVTVASTSLIANSIGESNEEKTLNYFTHSIYYGIIVSIIIAFIGLTYADNIFDIMVTSPEVKSLGLEYTNIIFIGSVVFILVVCLNALLHAEGDTKTYRNLLILSFFLNIILNPIFIFGFLFIPAMGVKGIAIATIISQFISLLIIFLKILKNKRVKQLVSKHFNPKFEYFKNLLFQSVPITVSISASSFAFTVVITYVGNFGEYAVAGYGAGERFVHVMLLPVLGLNTAIVSIIGQNFGANNYDRIKEAYYTAIKYGVSIMIISGFIVYFIADIIIGLFSNNLDVIESGKQYLKIQTFAFPAYTIFFMCNGFFIGLKKAEYAMASNLIRNFAIPVTVYYIAIKFTVSLTTFFWLWSLSNIAYSTLILLFVMFFIKNKLDKSSVVVQP
tara:strand:- start:2771 stop:4126 length:1356 start_codon:yes stop_codon:yes gene_type:complete